MEPVLVKQIALVVITLISVMWLIAARYVSIVIKSATAELKPIQHEVPALPGALQYITRLHVTNTLATVFPLIATISLAVFLFTILATNSAPVPPAAYIPVIGTFAIAYIGITHSARNVAVVAEFTKDVLLFHLVMTQAKRLGVNIVVVPSNNPQQ